MWATAPGSRADLAPRDPRPPPPSSPTPPPGHFTSLHLSFICTSSVTAPPSAFGVSVQCETVPKGPARYHMSPHFTDGETKAQPRTPQAEDSSVPHALGVPFAQGMGHTARWKCHPESPGREGWEGRGVSLRPTGPGEGCTSRAWEGTWVWALGTTSRLDVSPRRPQGLGTRAESPPSPATLVQPAAAAHPSHLHKRRMPGLKEGRSLSRCTPRPLTCRGQAQPYSLAKWPSPGPRAPFSLALPTLFISGLHLPPRPRPRLGILSPTRYRIARTASASPYTLLVTHSVSKPVPAPALC